MMRNDFETEMRRLIDRYGPKFFSPRVVQYIWNQCSDLSLEWFSRTVTIFEGEQRPPKLSEISAAVTTERDRLWRDQKLSEFKQDKRSTAQLTKADVRSLIELFEHKSKSLNDRLAKKDFLNNFERTIKQKACSLCEEGIVIAYRKGMPSIPSAFLCNCSQGMRRTESYPRWAKQFEFNYQIGSEPESGGAA